MEGRGTMKFQIELDAGQLATLHIALTLGILKWPGTSTETEMKNLSTFVTNNFKIIDGKEA